MAWLAVANYLRRTYHPVQQDLSVAKVIDVKAKDGSSSRVSAVYQAPQRRVLSSP